MTPPPTPPGPITGIMAPLCQAGNDSGWVVGSRLGPGRG